MMYAAKCIIKKAFSIVVVLCCCCLFALFVSWEMLFLCNMYCVYGWNDNKPLLNLESL